MTEHGLTCGWCRGPRPQNSRHQRFCGRKCRQSAHRARKLIELETANAQPGRFAYFDPPYPGRAWMYRDQDTYGGEVDHAALIASAESSGYVGWALSTSADALQALLPLCPPAPLTRVCPWVKPTAPAPATRGPHNTWEALIVVRGRKLRPGFRDWLLAQPARHGGSLMGRKPLKFCAFLFQQLGMLPGDELVDAFPGTGVVSRAWAEVCRAAGRPYPRGSSDAYPPGAGDGETSGEVLGDGLLSLDGPFARSASDAGANFEIVNPCLNVRRL
jgi:hypothetical protein